MSRSNSSPSGASNVGHRDVPDVALVDESLAEVAEAAGDALTPLERRSRD